MVFIANDGNLTMNFGVNIARNLFALPKNKPIIVD